MNPFRIALANLRFPATPEESISLATRAIERASEQGAQIICFKRLQLGDAYRIHWQPQTPEQGGVGAGSGSA